MKLDRPREVGSSRSLGQRLGMDNRARANNGAEENRRYPTDLSVRNTSIPDRDEEQPDGGIFPGLDRMKLKFRGLTSDEMDENSADSRVLESHPSDDSRRAVGSDHIKKLNVKDEHIRGMDVGKLNGKYKARNLDFGRGDEKPIPHTAIKAGLDFRTLSHKPKIPKPVDTSKFATSQDLGKMRQDITRFVRQQIQNINRQRDNKKKEKD